MSRGERIDRPTRRETSEASRRRRESRELERRIRQADRDWKAHPEWRKEVAPQMGTDTHGYIERKFRKAERRRGRREGPATFEIERTVRGADGRRHRIDIWDHERRRIVDIKPVREGEKVGKLIEKHGDQLLRYAKAAESATGEKVKEVAILPYPATDGGKR